MQRNPATREEYANLHLTWLMEELRERGEADPERT
jgi:hypothetical protein